MPWLQKSASCPVCRYELQTSDPAYEKQRLARMKSRKLRARKDDLLKKVSRIGWYTKWKDVNMCPVLYNDVSMCLVLYNDVSMCPVLYNDVSMCPVLYIAFVLYLFLVWFVFVFYDGI